MRKIARRIAATTVASGIIAAGAVGLAGAASASTLSPAHGTSYSFQTLNNANDPTFNQLLGINDFGLISGYFGSGAAGHPNKGYLLEPNHIAYINENFPGSVQTQVTGLNNTGISVGFWSNTNMGVGMDANFGFVDVHGQFRNASFPTGDGASPAVDQLLGVNDQDIAVGFWADANGNSHGYAYDIRSGRFSSITASGVHSRSAAAINNLDQVAGFYTNPATGNTDGFVKANGRFIDLAVPGASSTMALGVN